MGISLFLLCLSCSGPPTASTCGGDIIELSPLQTHLGLLPSATTPLRVMVRNGQQLECNCVSEAIIVDIQDTKFTIELYVLLISGANVVFGVQWLKLLGPVLTNYNSLSMKFFHDGCLVELKGDKKSTLNSLSLP